MVFADLVQVEQGSVNERSLQLMYRQTGSGKKMRLLAALACLAWVGDLAQEAAAADVTAGFERTERRDDCQRYAPLRQPLFGDLHVHTSYSHDAWVSLQRNDPWDAYRFAKGETLTQPDAEGEFTVRTQISRPLDFAAVTDHAEYLGELNLCTRDSSKLAYWMPQCMLGRADNFFLRLLAARYWSGLGAAGRESDADRSSICSVPGSDCKAAALDTWTDIQRAAEDHYDRSSDCRFTTFVAYEYTDAPEFRNMHRNVIFRNDQVTLQALSVYATGSYQFPRLWELLREQCIDAQDRCDAMVIPHNPNLSGGLMFRDPPNAKEARERLFFEPVVEITQHKGSSECRFDRLAGRGLGTTDELCTFEQYESDNLQAMGVLYGELRSEGGRPKSLEEFAPRNMLRNTLKDGLALQAESGVNPFKMGFIGSTDTHNATPGGTEEDRFIGHLGQRDGGYRNIQDHFADNPGGLAVVWAEENSRDSIFAAIRRKETYATSGTRPIVRFFGGYGLSGELCQTQDLAARGYKVGVPMGGTLSRGDTDASPGFVVSALKDPGVPGGEGSDLQRIQIIKGWLDGQGNTREQVFDVAGDSDNGAWVDTTNCDTIGRGARSLCAVWEDPDFDPRQRAFYYARVLENPSCRWSTRHCLAAGVNPFAADCRSQADALTAKLREEAGARGDVYGNCCKNTGDEAFYSPVIQERAWTSPIWYEPAGPVNLTAGGNHRG